MSAFPPQHQPKPGLESELRPRTPRYEGSGKLEGKVALINPAFVFFASATDSSYVTGEVLTLLGGEATAA